MKEGAIGREIEEAFVVLIPKTNRSENIKQFQPISLCTFKLLTKVLADRLKEMLTEVISLNQSNFIPRKQITNNIVVCQEMLHTLKTKKGRKGGMVVKIDLEKSYDRM